MLLLVCLHYCLQNQKPLTRNTVILSNAKHPWLILQIKLQKHFIAFLRVLKENMKHYSQSL